MLLVFICQIWLLSIDNLAKKIYLDLNYVATSETFKKVRLNIYDPCKINELKKFVIYEPSHRARCFSNEPIDLSQNPETNTGYRYGAKEVWAHIFNVDLDPQYQSVMKGLKFSITTHICKYYLKTGHEYSENPALYRKLFCKQDYDDFNRLLAFIYTKFLSFDLKKFIIPKKLYDKLCNIHDAIRASKLDVKMNFTFRPAFKRVFTILNCVGCEKCRLWGKVKVIGLNTAFAIQNGYHPRNMKELILFIQLMSRLTTTSLATHRFNVNK